MCICPEITWYSFKVIKKTSNLHNFLIIAIEPTYILLMLVRSLYNILCKGCYCYVACVFMMVLTPYLQRITYISMDMLQIVFDIFLVLAWQLTQHHWAGPFMKPVDVVGLGLHDYFEVMLLIFLLCYFNVIFQNSISICFSVSFFMCIHWKQSFLSLSSCLFIEIVSFVSMIVLAVLVFCLIKFTLCVIC